MNENINDNIKDNMNENMNEQIKEIVTLLSFSILNDKRMAALVAMKVMSELRAKKNIKAGFLPVFGAILAKQHSVKMYQNLNGVPPVMENWSYIYPSTKENTDSCIDEAEYLIKKLSPDALDIVLLCATKTMSPIECAPIFEITLMESVQLYFSSISELKRICRKSGMTKEEIRAKGDSIASKIASVFGIEQAVIPDITADIDEIPSPPAYVVANESKKDGKDKKDRKDKPDKPDTVSTKLLPKGYKREWAIAAIGFAVLDAVAIIVIILIYMWGQDLLTSPSANPDASTPASTSTQSISQNVNDDKLNYEISALPSGFSEVKREKTDTFSVVAYENKEGKTITFSQQISEKEIKGFDTTNTNGEEITINGKSAFMTFEADVYTIYSFDKYYAYVLISNLSKEETIEIAKSIKTES